MTPLISGSKFSLINFQSPQPSPGNPIIFINLHQEINRKSETIYFTSDYSHLIEDSF